MNLYIVKIQHEEYSSDDKLVYVACESFQDIEALVKDKYGYSYSVKSTEEIGNKNNFIFKTPL